MLASNLLLNNLTRSFMKLFTNHVLIYVSFFVKFRSTNPTILQSQISNEVRLFKYMNNRVTLCFEIYFLLSFFGRIASCVEGIDEVFSSVKPNRL